MRASLGLDPRDEVEVPLLHEVPAFASIGGNGGESVVIERDAGGDTLSGFVDVGVGPLADANALANEVFAEFVLHLGVFEFHTSSIRGIAPKTIHPILTMSLIIPSL